jgi:hypothetical protein
MYYLLIVLFALSVVQADFFTDRFGGKCDGYPQTRVRKSWTDLTAEERTLYPRLAFAMRQYKDIPGEEVITGSSSKSLYDLFAEIHGTSNVGWHSTILFPFAHKGLLWLYESALIWIALKVGPTMNPPITVEQACTFALPYWEWEKCAGASSLGVNHPIYKSDIWDGDKTHGLGTPYTDSANNYYVTDGLFSNYDKWVLRYPTCVVPTSPDSCNTAVCTKDAKLKRYFTSTSAPSTDPTTIMSTLYSKSTSDTFISWICGPAHNSMHGFVGFSMGRTLLAGDDPLFWLHHCNVDRLFHMWIDCNEYERVNPKELSIPKQFSNTILSGGSGGPYTLDTKITYYNGGSKSPLFIPSQNFPTSRDLWPNGIDPSVPGWNGLNYVYGYDRLCSNSISSTCAPGNTWTIINQGKPLKRAVLDDGDLLYANITQTFLRLTEEEGMSPRDAVDKMAYDFCKATPFVLDDYNRSILKAFGIPLSSLKRSCDDFPEDEPQEAHHMTM